MYYLGRSRELLRPGVIMPFAESPWNHHEITMHLCAVISNRNCFMDKVKKIGDVLRDFFSGSEEPLAVDYREWRCRKQECRTYKCNKS